jgi:hypothetical protein
MAGSVEDCTRLVFQGVWQVLPEKTLRTYYNFVSADEEPPFEFEAVRNIPSHGDHPAVFDFKYIVIPEINNFHFWAMLFWDRLIMMIGFHDPDCSCSSCKQRSKGNQGSNLYC